MRETLAGHGAEQDFVRWLRGIAAECGSDRSTLIRRRHRRIYAAGDHDHSLYLLHDGWIAIQMPCPDGRQVTVDLLGPGAVFGEMGLSGQQGRPDGALVLRGARVTRVPFAAILPRLTGPQHGGELLHHFIRRIDEARGRFADLQGFKSEQRLALVMERLFRKFGYPVGSGLLGLASITQQDLAEVVGTTRARIGEFLQRFHSRRLVMVYRGDSYVADPQALLAYAIGDPAGAARQSPARVRAARTGSGNESALDAGRLPAQPRTGLGARKPS